MKILAILNITSDSFYQKSIGKEELVDKISDLLLARVDIIDVGVESSNPAGEDVKISEQLIRLDLFFNLFSRCFAQLKQQGLVSEKDKPMVSIDSYRLSVLKHGLEAGAGLINDISGLQDLKLLELATEYNAKLISMYNLQKSNPRALAEQESSLEITNKNRSVENHNANDIVEQVTAGLQEIAEKAKPFGLKKGQLILDPGMGFFLGSNPKNSYQVLAALPKLKTLGYPLCVSVSHKSFLNIDIVPAARGQETILAEYELIKMGIEYIRSHDPSALRRSVRFYNNLSQI